MQILEMIRSRNAARVTEAREELRELIEKTSPTEKDAARLEAIATTLNLSPATLAELVADAAERREIHRQREAMEAKYAAKAKAFAEIEPKWQAAKAEYERLNAERERCRYGAGPTRYARDLEILDNRFNAAMTGEPMPARDLTYLR